MLAFELAGHFDLDDASVTKEMWTVVVVADGMSETVETVAIELGHFDLEE